jgi:hypothetical protein
MELLPRLSGLGAAAAASAFFGSWAKTNSSAAMNAAASIEPRAVRESAMEGLLREWGGRDPHAMMKWASGKDKPTAKLAFRSLFQMRGPRNPAVVLELAREFPDAAEPFVLTNTAGDLVAQGAEGWKSIADFPQGTLRDGMVRWFATRFSEMDPKAAWELAKSLSPEDRKIFVNWSTIREFAKIAPEESAKFVLASDPADRLHISEVISAWADKDPQAAFAWSAQNLKGPEMPSSLGSALFQWAKHDPAAALAAADDLAPGMRAQLLSNVLTSWGQSDPRKAFDFAKQMPGIDRDRAMENVIKGWSYADPVAAAGALAAMPSVGLGGAFDSVAWQLGDKDPAFGFNWAEGLSEAGTGASAVQKITEDWGKKDASAASDRISKLKTGEFRDHAIQGLVESIRNLDPDSAAAWADSIGGPDARAKTLRTVVDNWRATDHAAAQTFVTGMAPGSLKTEMQRLLDSKSSPDEPFIR